MGGKKDVENMQNLILPFDISGFIWSFFFKLKKKKIKKKSTLCLSKVPQVSIIIIIKREFKLLAEKTEPKCRIDVRSSTRGQLFFLFKIWKLYAHHKNFFNIKETPDEFKAKKKKEENFYTLLLTLETVPRSKWLVVISY